MVCTWFVFKRVRTTKMPVIVGLERFPRRPRGQTGDDVCTYIWLMHVYSLYHLATVYVYTCSLHMYTMS